MRVHSVPNLDPLCCLDSTNNPWPTQLVRIEPLGFFIGQFLIGEMGVRTIFSSSSVPPRLPCLPRLPRLPRPPPPPWLPACLRACARVFARAACLIIYYNVSCSVCVYIYIYIHRYNMIWYNITQCSMIYNITHYHIMYMLYVYIYIYIQIWRYYVMHHNIWSNML